MKMGVGTRILFTLVMLFIIFVSLVIIGVSFGLIPAESAQELANGLLYTDYKYIWAGASVLLIVICAPMIFFGTRKSGGEAPASFVNQKSVTLLETADGSVSITVSALTELARRYLASVAGLMSYEVYVSVNEERTINLKVSVTFRPEIVIPEVTANISKGLTEYINLYSCILVSEVAIDVLPTKPAK